MLDQFTTLADGLDHPEGVAVAADGTVYAGGEAGQLYAVGPDGKPDQIATTGGFALGLALDGDGRAYVCDMARAEVMRISPDGRVETYSAGAPGAPFRAPNHPAFDADGNLYVTDSGGWDADDGLIYRIAPGGDTRVWTDKARRFPNGCALSPRRDALYVVESTIPGVTRVPIDPDDGTAGTPEVVVELPGTVPDGIAFDQDGRFYVACYRPDRIYLVTPDGQASVFAEDPRGTVLAAPTNVAFTGPQRRTMVVGSLGRWHLAAVEVDVPGAPLEYPKLP